jgi:hypothetical protein
MIFHPKPGERVRLHYRRQDVPWRPWHGRVGVVARVGRGPGPINVGVLIDGVLVVVPRGNIVRVDAS